MDGRNIYELCDYNVVYELSLWDAINKGVLVPFHYYGIYDETVNYADIKVRNGRYIEKELTHKLMLQKRYDLIYQYYSKYKLKRALGFCCSRMHAEKMAKEFSGRGVSSVAEYSRVKEFLNGKVPTRVELFTYMEDEIYQLCLKNPQKNPFRNYLLFLDIIGELIKEEKKLYNGIGREVIHFLETTKMTKSYKIPVLYAFLDKDKVRMEITGEEINRSYRSFYDSGFNWKDLIKDKGTSDYWTWGKERFIREAMKNPVKYLLQSSEGFFVESKSCVLAFHQQLKEVVKQHSFAKHMKDILDYRTLEYYRRNKNRLH